MPVAYFIDPNGETVEGDAASGAALLASGYAPASPEQAAEFVHKDEQAKQYGTPLEQVKTAAEGALSGATFGLSDAAETGLGISTPEAMKARAETNPWTHGIATAGGIGTAALLSGGLTGEAEALGGAGRALAPAAEMGAADYLPTNLVSRLGKFVTKSATPTVAADSMLGRIGQKAVASGAGSAVEGAFYGAGQAVHEHALGDPQDLADSIVAHVGLGTLLGAGVGLPVGAAAGLGSGILSKLAGAADDAGDRASWGEKVKEWADDFVGERGLKAAGAIQNNISKLERTVGPDDARAIGREMFDLGLVGGFKTKAQTLELAKALKADVGPKMSDLLAAADEAATPKQMPNVAKIFREVREGALAKVQENPGLVNVANQFGDLLDRWEAKFTEQAAVEKEAVKILGMPAEVAERLKDRASLVDLHDMRQQVDDLIPWGKEPADKAYGRALRSLRRRVSTAIDDGIESAGADVGEWKDLNRKFQVASVAQDFAQKGMQRAAGNNLVPLTSILGAVGGAEVAGPLGALASGIASYGAKNFGSGLLGSGVRAAQQAIEGTAPETVAALAALERTAQSVNASIDSAASTLVRAGAKAANISRAEVAAGLAKSHGFGYAQSAAEFAKHAAQIRTLAADPAAAQAAIQQQGAPLYEHAPDTTTALGATSARAVSYLNSQLPPDIKPGPLSPVLPHSREAIATYQVKQNAVDRPTSLIKQAAAGTLTQDAVDAVATVHPTILNKMRSAVIAAIAKHPNVPYHVIPSISLLMGQDMDGSESVSMIAGNQAAYARTAPSAKPAPQPPTGTSKLTLASRTALDQQKAGRDSQA